jgi:hypothetical protein
MERCPELTSSNSPSLYAANLLDWPRLDPAQEYVEVGSGEPIESENLVEFHLLYTGPLHSSGSASPRIEKHAIRKVFHSQLRHLWETHPNLKEWTEGHGSFGITQEDAAALPAGERFQRGALELAKWNRNGFNFLPLVTEAVALRCSLDILFLRTDGFPFVLRGGDIDGRLKILFDSMRMPDKGDELPVGAAPEVTENPMFILLQDDKLISEVHVNTARLLKLPDNKPIDEHDVYLQITVRLNTTIKVANCWVFE